MKSSNLQAVLLAPAAFLAIVFLAVGISGSVSNPKATAASPCQTVEQIGNAKAELLLTTKPGTWYAKNLTATGHWKNAWNILNQIKAANPDVGPSITNAKKELLLTTKAGTWWAVNLNKVAGHWKNAWNLLHAAECGTPPTPTNLRVSGVTETSATLQWGPSVIGNFLKPVTSSTSTLTIAWEPSFDDSGISHYTITRVDGTVLGTSTTPQFALPVSTSATSFRVCVYATNGLDQNGPHRCAIYTRNS